MTFSKNHDFGGGADAEADVPQLVQYREFLPAVVSDFELFVLSGKPDTATAFRKFATTKAGMWGEFVAKWVDTDFSGERLVIHYEDLTRDPVTWLGRAVTFSGGSVDRHVLEEVVRSEQAQAVTSAGEVWTANAGVVNTRRVQDFRFYDPAVFELVQAHADAARRAAASTG
ncbi:sulfotransferase domain-containing protein [Nocardioides sp.]|uniref:sulfotransferase domain-containing protein n=1 Tax=Nocardioides sp. TaxID=35761 RepID=UPI0026355430|nr:sulfotransferase domain-containing protein [Nocardioides sp.]MDI6910881.1 sulfotransferase domain-containing protein [Nocardioides sp.]